MQNVHVYKIELQTITHATNGYRRLRVTVI